MEYKFIDACQKGNINEAKELLKTYPNIINFDKKEYYKKAFAGACGNGHLKVAQWLLQIKPTIDISADNEYAFRRACAHGKLKVAQWLLFIKPNINVSANYNDAFMYACLKGYLHLAQWLLQIKPTIDISINNDIIFMRTCKNSSNLNMAEWLQSLMPFKYIITKYGKIRPHNVSNTLALICVLKIKGYALHLTANLVFAIANRT